MTTLNACLKGKPRSSIRSVELLNDGGRARGGAAEALPSTQRRLGLGLRRAAAVAPLAAPRQTPSGLPGPAALSAARCALLARLEMRLAGGGFLTFRHANPSLPRRCAFDPPGNTCASPAASHFQAHHPPPPSKVAPVRSAGGTQRPERDRARGGRLGADTRQVPLPSPK